MARNLNSTRELRDICHRIKLAKNKNAQKQVIARLTYLNTHARDRRFEWIFVCKIWIVERLITIFQLLRKWIMTLIFTQMLFQFNFAVYFFKKEFQKKWLKHITRHVHYRPYLKWKKTCFLWIRRMRFWIKAVQKHLLQPGFRSIPSLSKEEAY